MEFTSWATNTLDVLKLEAARPIIAEASGATNTLDVLKFPHVGCVLVYWRRGNEHIRCIELMVIPIVLSVRLRATTTSDVLNFIGHPRTLVEYQA